jgi:hypothetical protein
VLLRSGHRWLALSLPLILLGDSRPLASLFLPTLRLAGCGSGRGFTRLPGLGADRVRHLKQMLHAGNGEFAFRYLGPHDVHGLTKGGGGVRNREGSSGARALTAANSSPPWQCTGSRPQTIDPWMCCWRGYPPASPAGHPRHLLVIARGRDAATACVDVPTPAWHSGPDRASEESLNRMAGFDAAERELDAAFGRFEALIARLQGWRRTEAEAERRGQEAEAEALRLVEETEAAAEQARGEAARARAERDKALTERDRLAAELAAERGKLASEIAGLRARSEQQSGDAAQRAAAAERQIHELRAAFDAAQQQLKALQAERDRLQQQATQLATGRQNLERETILLKGEGERLNRELAAARARGERLEQVAHKAAEQLRAGLGQP